MSISAVPGGVRIALHVQPRAARTEIVGRHGDALKIRVAAPPVDGAANEAIVEFLARALEIPRNAVTLVAGASGRRKIVEIATVTADRAAAVLLGGWHADCLSCAEEKSIRGDLRSLRPR